VPSPSLLLTFQRGPYVLLGKKNIAGRLFVFSSVDGIAQQEMNNRACPTLSTQTLPEEILKSRLISVYPTPCHSDKFTPASECHIQSATMYLFEKSYSSFQGLIYRPRRSKARNQGTGGNIVLLDPEEWIWQLIRSFQRNTPKETEQRDDRNIPCGQSFVAGI